ncbi:hypothetical protein, partial [Pseudomonas viridiflava]|uniref:hypothetical protein n=1 Tax=Pseudomonas viridiflava TaxID=33069 RepID=UPI0019D1EA62
MMANTITLDALKVAPTAGGIVTALDSEKPQLRVNAAPDLSSQKHAEARPARNQRRPASGWD